MPLAFYLDFATKQEGLRRFIDSKGLLTPWIGSLSCRPLPPSNNKGKDLAVIKQILHWYILSERKIRVPFVYYISVHLKNIYESGELKKEGTIEEFSVVRLSNCRLLQQKNDSQIISLEVVAILFILPNVLRIYAFISRELTKQTLMSDGREAKIIKE